ncbi:cation diffusion facilitator family transporter [Parvibium lacunae]|uniref:Cation transporter n=1 Tax=Parvibium lacunae TaxID=1888893 RepID=A0A368L9J5_9BURK|nr:cation diffusion facilitator family transporter [Parvibium lacunae]RCS59909.1 cation transporter [Parvibium lacunae]
MQASISKGPVVPADWHGHQHGDATHSHHLHAETQSLHRMVWALILTATFALAELFGGVLSGSLALLSDAGHMTTDVAALGLAVCAQWWARRPANQDWSFGLARAEVLAAFLNSLAMLVLIAWISYEAIQRLRTPEPVAAEWVMGIAILGLLCNLLVYRLLHAGHRHDDVANSLNRRAALVHVVGDLLGSLAALIAGAVIYLTGWTLIDPLLSFVICLLLLRSTWRVLRESVEILLEAVPKQISYVEVARTLEALPGVAGIHDLHIWLMAANQPALIAHLQLHTPEDWYEVLSQARQALQGQFGISHVTLQPEWSPLSAHSAEERLT